MRGGNMATKRREYWSGRDLIMLATLCVMQKCHVKAIIDRKRGVSVKKAKVLEEMAAVLGKDVPWTAWVDNQNTEHVAFKQLK